MHDTDRRAMRVIEDPGTSQEARQRLQTILGESLEVQADILEHRTVRRGMVSQFEGAPTKVLHWLLDEFERLGDPLQKLYNRFYNSLINYENTFRDMNEERSTLDGGVRWVIPSQI